MDRPDVDALEKFGWLKFTRGMGGFEGGSESVHSLCAWIRHLEKDIPATRSANNALMGRCERQQARIKELETQLRWIQVTERLPEIDGARCVVLTKFINSDGTPGTAYYIARYVGGEWYCDGCKLNIVTHWQPLPEGPEGR